MPDAEIWLVRHGETEWSLTGRHTGRSDIPLTPRGVRQAEMLGRLSGQGACAELSPDLLEWDYGRWEGRTSLEIRREVPDWTLWTGAVPGGETLDQVGERVDRVLERVRGAPGDVILFAHGHVLRVLAARWLGLTARDGRYLGLDTASLSSLGHEREQPVVRSWNESYDLVEAP